MLRQRIITAIVLALLVLTAVLAGSTTVFALFISVVVTLAAWEWANLSGLRAYPARSAYTASVLVVVALTWAVLPLQLWLVWLLALACLGWLTCLLLIKQYPANVGVWRSQWIRLLSGFLVLIPAWHAFVYLHGLTHGKWLVITLITTVAAADIGAYFSGKNFGRRRLAPKVSPGKTWEGVVGGTLLAVVFLGATMALTVNFPIWWAALLGMPVVLFSVVGDLFESMLKRERGIKDSGTILPGHGGMLDRIDGLVAAAPVFALVVFWSGWSL